LRFCFSDLSVLYSMDTAIAMIATVALHISCFDLIILHHDQKLLYMSVICTSSRLTKNGMAT